MLLQITVNGFATGTIYALVALGIVLIYKSTETINFAQGEMLMISAYVAFFCYHNLHLSIIGSVVASIVFSAFLGIFIERLIIRPTINAPLFNALIVTIGLSMVLKTIAGIIWTFDEQLYPRIFSQDTLGIGTVELSKTSLGIIVSAFGLMIILFLFFKFTKIGTAMRAVSQNKRGALVVGISVDKVSSLSWAISSILGAIAGAMLAPVLYLSPQMGSVVINGFIAAIIGGFGSIPGAVLGGILLGIIENIVPLCFSSELKYTIPFVILILILFIRPYGLLGSPELRKV